MPLYELTLQGTYNGEQTINRWTYLSTGVPAAVSRSFALVHAFGALYDLAAAPPGYPPGTLFDKIRDVVVSMWQPQQITALAVYDPVDFYQTPFVQAAAGRDGGDPAPPFTAYGFRTNVVRRDISRATKRFAGVSETGQHAGGMVEAAKLTQLNALAVLMTDPLEYDDEGQNISFAPCVVGKLEYDPNPGGDPEKNHVAYKYYATEVLQAEHLATGIIWSPYNTIRSQTSRQFGRGA